MLNINNGKRFTTYTIPATRGSCSIQVNGAAARIVHKGDLVIIIAYCEMDQNEAKNHKPKVILLDKNNAIY